MIPAVGYIRVSGPGQANGDGPTRQRAAITAWATTNGYAITRWYEDAHTGTDLKRPAWHGMLYDLKEDPAFTTIVIEKLDRLARDLMVQEASIRDLQAAGFRLVSVAEGPDLQSDDKSRTFIRQMFGALAQYDKANLVERLLVARQRRRGLPPEGKAGRWVSGPRPKYPPEVPALIRQLRAEGGLTWRAVAAELNRRRVPTATGKRSGWSGALAAAVARTQYPVAGQAV